MIALSTSSPMVSVALGEPGIVLASERAWAPRAAAETIFALLDRALLAAGRGEARETDDLVVDVGPGSFTGTRVGVAVAKTLAWLWGRRVAAVTSFDLVATDRPVVVPCRRGEWFFRRPGEEPIRVPELPAETWTGYESLGEENGEFPAAERAFTRGVSLDWMAPERLVPYYLAEPHITHPKRPFGLRSESDDRDRD